MCYCDVHKLEVYLPRYVFFVELICQLARFFKRFLSFWEILLVDVHLGHKEKGFNRYWRRLVSTDRMLNILESLVNLPKLYEHLMRGIKRNPVVHVALSYDLLRYHKRVQRVNSLTALMHLQKNFHFR